VEHPVAFAQVHRSRDSDVKDGRSILTTETEPSSNRHTGARRRWYVHLSLILGFLVASLSPIFLSRRYLGHSGTTNHAIIAVVVFAIVVVHLTQRRNTIRRLLSRFRGRRPSTTERLRQASSDMILWILTLNAMVSGIVDFVLGHVVHLPIPGPFILQKWHAISALVLVGYVITHVVRRRRRLRTSHIR